MCLLWRLTGQYQNILDMYVCILTCCICRHSSIDIAAQIEKQHAILYFPVMCLLWRVKGRKQNIVGTYVCDLTYSIYRHTCINIAA